MRGAAPRKRKMDDLSDWVPTRGTPTGDRLCRGEVFSPDAGIHVLILKVITRWGMLFRWGRLIWGWAGRGNPAPPLGVFG